MQSSGRRTRSGPHRECSHLLQLWSCTFPCGAVSRDGSCITWCRRDRTKLGLLERKKDYKVRAEDFHRKERALRSLQRKAEERNPDEFYFAMQKARTRGGVHVKRCAPTCWLLAG